ncbi:MAG: MlaD family protein [bacterium]|jgi:phospholipid/cholesterol/gamma-HCH transport system substrate-binding protein
MRQRSTEIKVGITVIAAVVILILGVMWVEKVSFSKKFVTYVVYFHDVGGLDPGDPVTVSGVDGGEVASVILEPGRVRTELMLGEGITLFDDARVEILTIGLMGEKYVGIDPGHSGVVLEPGSVIEGHYYAGMAEAIAGFGNVIAEINETLRAFRALIETGEGGVSLATTMQSIDEVSTEILAILKENRSDIKSTAKSMRELSGDFSDVVGSRKEKLTRGIDDFSSAAARLDSVTVSLKAVARKIESGDGTLGMLINEKKLHEDLELVLENLNALLEDIKADPRKYFKVEIF